MSDQFKKTHDKGKQIETALKYTKGDVESAKLMAAGKLQDITVIKCKFVIPRLDTSGLFFAFVNVGREEIVSIKTVLVSNSSIFANVKILDDWNSLLKKMHVYENSSDVVDSETINGDLFDFLVKFNIFPDVESLNRDSLSVTIQDIIKKSFNSDKVKCQLEFENSSSMDIDLAGINIAIPDSEYVTKEKSSSKSINEGGSDFEKMVQNIESKALSVVEGASILSPVKGVFVSEIKTGENIYVMIKGKDNVSSKIINEYKARDSEGNLFPIVGKVVDKISNSDIGYILYVLVAKDIFAKIIEEDNVKIQTEITKVNVENLADKGSDEDKKTLLGAFIYVFFLLLICGIVMLLFLL